jgi:O-acetyl-ADP-ribose deacetylase (regulator of RNase III)
MSPAGRIELAIGDITEQDVDAIVNAAKESLLGGGGVDGAIHRAAGPRLLDECRTLGGCPTGEAKVTGGYDLPARHVIHTVGPVWQGGDRGEDALLASCYRNSLARAVEIDAATVAFPSVSTGVYAFPLDRAAPIALGAVHGHLEAHDTPSRVTFVLFDERTHEAYERALGAL